MSKKIRIGPYIKSHRNSKTGEEYYRLSKWSKKHLITDPCLAKVLFTAESISNENGVFPIKKLSDQCSQRYGFSPEIVSQALEKLTKMKYIVCVRISEFLIIKERLENERPYLELLIKYEGVEL